jgi:2-(1,2-epoxy-1,2-dihydrophenyl)acetyl-CoA isomerase
LKVIPTAALLNFWITPVKVDKMDHSESTALTRDFYEALANGDRQRLAELLHPEFMGHATEGLPLGLGGDYRGPDEMRRNFWGKIAKNFAAKAQPSEFRTLDDGRLLVQGRYVGEARISGAKLDAEFIHILSFTAGQISGLKQLTDSERWAKAVKSASDQRIVEFSVNGGLATIRMNRVEAYNALDASMADELYAVAQRCANNPSIRAVLLLGNGKSFTVGGDLPFLSKTKNAELPGLLRSMTGRYHDAMRTFSRLSVPIVAAVQGAAAGGGLGMMYCADIVLAAENTKIALGFGSLGLSTDGGNSWFLPRLVGMRRAAELYFEGRVLNASEALEWGLVTRIVPLAELEEQALACANRLANGPTRAFGEMRRLFRESLNATLSEQLGAETEALCRTAATADATDAIASFVGKRKPVFHGR